MRVVTTGAAGFIGSTLVDRLLREGHSVLAVDDLSTGHLDNLADSVGDPRLRLLQGDVAADATRREMESYQAEVFFHLAAQMDVRHSVADPVADARRNVLGSLAVLESARASGARKLVFASSGGTIYGDQVQYPVHESALVDPVSPYGAAKVCGETYLRVYRHLHRLQTTALALGNVYGPRQDPHGEAGVVSIFAAALLDGRPTMIFGDGKATRDYVYVDDVVEAFVLAAGSAGDGLRLNIGTGRETSIRHLHRLIAEAVERPDTPKFMPPRAGELNRVALASSAAERVLGWRPKMDLTEGLAQTVAWLRDKATVRPLHAVAVRDLAAFSAVESLPSPVGNRTVRRPETTPAQNGRGWKPEVIEDAPLAATIRSR
ncbi:UDP-glucose 4-epimerase [Micromonospora kangleipakensis]|uniref:UDP-glucose 4-epimerase n=1 Tax=Micromonospora kangleipakensis TaxID=1077942 RepID=A0A4Q8BEK3_9ACTN|nr:NAD-dependent epimerase/dehydratase family protein [Micromonospora kangleipakensis]RZU75791.1 UDP-glucose 4-epimerase [Micromonospora kangleipakensis]